MKKNDTVGSFHKILHGYWDDSMMKSLTLLSHLRLQLYSYLRKKKKKKVQTNHKHSIVITLKEMSDWQIQHSNAKMNNGNRFSTTHEYILEMRFWSCSF